jgi:hypothetical protein
MVMSEREIHIRKRPDDAAAKPVWCGQTGVASITEAWGYYGPGSVGYDDVCRACISAHVAHRRSPSQGARQ